MATRGSIVITTDNTAVAIFMPKEAGPKTAGVKLLKALSTSNSAVLEDKTDMLQIVNPHDHITPQHRKSLKPYTINSARCKKYSKWAEGLHGNITDILNAGVYVEIEDYLEGEGVEWVYHVDFPRKAVTTIKNSKDTSSVVSQYSLSDIPDPKEYKESIAS